MRHALVSLALFVALSFMSGADAVAQGWNLFRSSATASNRNSTPAPTPGAQTEYSHWPHLSFPKLQSPFAPSPPGTPTLTERFNTSTQRFFTKTKEVVTAPIDTMSQKTQELSHWMQRMGSSPASNGSEAGSQASVTQGKPETVTEWLAQERP